MINADEHKKLLAQIAELEKNSINYFDVEKEFFLIHSNNLSQVRPRLYGYSIQRSGIYEDDDLTPEAIAGLDGRGCYVYVDVQDGKITIKQDINGCYGIYLFRHGDYFALSNSFFRLLDHAKFLYPLTVNRDYCLYQVTDNLCSISCSQTAVSEIQLVDRSAILEVDIITKNLEIELINHKEHSISPDSEEGIAILDNWIDFWGSVLRGLAQHTKFIQADLSGGFDSRLSLISLLRSGINLSNILVYSSDDGLRTHKEDYEIASKIAEHYKFKLNQPLPSRKVLNYSLTDIFNLDFYGCQTVTNMPKIFPKKGIDNLYRITGASGETLRHRWQILPKKFIETQSRKMSYYSRAVSNEIFFSIESIINSNFRTICEKYKIEDENSVSISQYMYYETWSRHHFGKDMLSNYLHNCFLLSPAIDPEIRTLRLNTSECTDYNLLLTLMFTRYAPDLLKFPFQGNRSIAPETIECAQKINERFPLVKNDKESISGEQFHLRPRDIQAEKILTSGRNNPNLPDELPDTCLKAVFESSRTFGLFTSYFDEELYHYAASYYDTHVFARNRPLCAIVGFTRVLEDVEISQRNRSQYQDMK
ncbi:MAG: hypothetical protein IJG33_12005, partial [Selenomonadaceae bacterium]|nr:hypothetical protein [Selenomonadaceae bacterium]